MTCSIFLTVGRLLGIRNSIDKFSSITGVAVSGKTNGCDVQGGDSGFDGSSRLEDQMLGTLDNISDSQGHRKSQGSTSIKLDPSVATVATHHSTILWPLSLKLELPCLNDGLRDLWSYYIGGPVKRLKLDVGLKVEDIVAELTEGVDGMQNSGIERMLPVILDSVRFKDGTLMLLAYGDKEPR